jgi:arylsulfatase A-like enzyme
MRPYVKAVALVLTAIFILSSAFLLVSCSKTHEENRPAFPGYNVIIICIDALRADHVGTYGYDRNTTPTIDTFATKSYVFKNAISASSWTLPSFMSLFTSLYPSKHGVLNKYTKFDEGQGVISNLSKTCPNCLTLAQLLKSNGYATLAFTGDAGVGSEYGFDKGFDYYYNNKTFGGFETSFAEASKWLQSNKDEKFFLFIHGYDCHGSFESATDKQFFSNNDYRGPYQGTRNEYQNLRNLTIYDITLDMSKEDVAFWNIWYDNKVRNADSRVSNFLSDLESLDLLNNTIIVITSDHGNEFYDHKGFDHGHTLYDELIRVPLIIYVPNHDGKVIEQQVRLVDVMPTLLELLEAKVSEKAQNQMQGTSLVPMMQGKRIDLDAFSETDYLLLSFKRSLRTHDGWKIIYTVNTNEKELYNLNTDPFEQKNLIKENPTKAAQLEKELYQYLGYR